MTIRNKRYEETLKVFQIDGRCPSKESRSASFYTEKIKNLARENIDVPILKNVGIEIDLFYAGLDNRPDIDNAEKLILDALKGVAFLDDSQVIESIKNIHDTTNFMSLNNQPIFLMDLLLKGIKEYLIIRIYEK